MSDAAAEAEALADYDNEVRPMLAPPAAPLAPEVRALALASMRQRIEAEEKLVRAEFSAALLAGTTLRFRSPVDDTPLGSVLRTDPKTEWRITDEGKLRAHLESEYPGTVENVVYLAVPGMGFARLSEHDELYRVLAEHAEHLLIRETDVRPEAMEAALAESKATGTAAAPGIEKIRPSGSIQVRPSKEAGEAVRKMFEVGALSWDALIPAAPKAVAS